MGEDLYELQKGWVWVKLGDICSFKNGINFQSSQKGEEGILTIDVLNMYSHSLLINTENLYRVNINLNDEYLLKSGDILFVRSSVKREGVGWASLFKPIKEDVTFCGFIIRARLNTSNIFPEFITYFFRSSLAREKIVAGSSQVTITNISQDVLRGFDIPLPPLPEQYRIVAKIEELFTQLDAGVELLKKVKAKLKRYRQTVLKAAVEGNLTKEWREAHQGELEPASVLLERILKQRREKWEAEQLAKMQAQGKTPKDDKWKLKYKEAIAPDTSNLPELPNGWCWVSAEQCTSLITDGEHITPERSESGVLLLSARNVQNGWLSLEEVDYVPEHIYKILAKRLVVEPGDVLLSCSGSVGRSCVAPENLKFALVRSVAVLKPFFLMGSFLSYSIRTPLLQSQINEKKTQTAQANIFQGKIKQLVFPLPNLLEQEKIVKEIEYCFSVIDQIEKTVDTNIKRAEKLRQSILKQAFTGQLVPQDSNDEPAEKLLERIKAEKEAIETEKKTQRTTKLKSTQPRKTKKSSTQLELNLNNQDV
ncbi:restriction endonuclease subunit S [Richelia sinica]|uniref:restriction endonuclease subunit S n=1 Tax=Richelia sinica TaxID=1357545 RepID=UPI001686DB34|nr:restriction endonuclease subunit S [Richelia sinica]MBD2667249.1 restriction endonuclease subunit S [Richelia sinica FACHB-800]